MATILNPLGNEYYSVGKGAVHFFPKPEGATSALVAGYRLGDPQQLSIQIEMTEEDIFSNEHDVRTKVGTLTTEQSVTGTLIVRQLSNPVRAASLMGKVGVFEQEAQTGVIVTFTDPGVYDLGHYGITVTSVMTDMAEPAEPGKPSDGGDYLIDTRSGKIEVFTPGLTLEYEVPVLSERFVTGIANGNGLVGKLVFTGVNKQGKRSEVVLYEVTLKPANGRDFVSDSEIQTVEFTFTAIPVSGKRAGFEIGYEIDLPALGEAA